MGPFPYIATKIKVFPIINDSSISFQPIMLLNQYFQDPLVESIEEIVWPFPFYLGKLVSIHLNKIMAGRWTSMISITQLHGICCLPFHLNHEGMNYFADNFKISRIIWNTNVFLKRTDNIHVYPKKHLGG